jgi:hypothetical protein
MAKYMASYNVRETQLSINATTVRNKQRPEFDKTVGMPAVV